MTARIKTWKPLFHTEPCKKGYPFDSGGASFKRPGVATMMWQPRFSHWHQGAFVLAKSCGLAVNRRTSSCSPLDSPPVQLQQRMPEERPKRSAWRRLLLFRLLFQVCNVTRWNRLASPSPQTRTPKQTAATTKHNYK